MCRPLHLCAPQLVVAVVVVVVMQPPQVILPGRWYLGEAARVHQTYPLQETDAGFGSIKEICLHQYDEPFANQYLSKSMGLKQTRASEVRFS